MRPDTQRNHQRDDSPLCFAQVAGSLEWVARNELEELGAKVIREIPRGLYIKADKKVLYRIVYESRIVQRLLFPIKSFPCHSEKYLYQQAVKNIDWPAIFGLEDKFSIEANVSGSAIKHSLYAGQILKDAICDSFRDVNGKRPDFSAKEPDIIFNLHIKNNQADISLDLGGGSLHRRGYRTLAGAAPLQETLAAAIIRITGWDGELPLLDPMCGSGTLLAEALMSYCRIPAGYLRKTNGLRYLPDYDEKLWLLVKREANAGMRELKPGLIRGSDISQANIEIALSNLTSLPWGGEILLKVSDFKALGKQAVQTIVTNPPYGIRIGESESIKLLYNDLGAWLRENCTGSTAYVLCGSAELVSELKLRNRWVKKLKNGDLETALAKLLLKESKNA